MQEISHANPELNTTLTAVLTALNLAEDCMRLQRAQKKWTREAAAAADKIRSLEEQLSKVNRN